MSSETDNTKPGERQRFSATPVAHYVFAICITTFAKTLYFAVQTYECLNGSGWDCRWSAAEVIVQASAPDFWSIPFLAVFYFLVLAACFLVFIAPMYALACSLGRRYQIQRNPAGISFWIAAWMLAFLSLAWTGSLFDRKHVPWAVDEHVSSTFAILGLFSGIVYCVLALLERD